MSDKKSPVLTCLSLSALALSWLSSPCAAEKARFVDDATCERLQPGRLQSARELLAESKDFKLNASQSSVNMQDAIRRARNLGKGATSLKGRLGAEAIDQYHKDLGDFQKHVQSYRAHLEQVEKDLGHCKETEKAYNEHLKKTKLHTTQFHLPDIPPPHLCPNMMLSEAENARLANQMKQDRERLALSEMELAEREAQLKDAVKDSANQDEALRKRNRLTEEERKLAGEFAGLKTELDLLNSQHRALLGGSTAPAVGVGNVSGKVKGK